jgi:hypothetical protein
VCVHDDGRGIDEGVLAAGGRQGHWGIAACASGPRASRPNWRCTAMPAAVPNGD